MDEAIIATPEQQLFAGGTYKRKKLSINLSVQHIRNLYTQLKPQKIKDSYTLINSKISWTVSKFADVFLKGENLTDK